MCKRCVRGVYVQQWGEGGREAEGSESAAAAYSVQGVQTSINFTKSGLPCGVTCSRAHRLNCFPSSQGTMALGPHWSTYKAVERGVSSPSVEVAVVPTSVK